MASYFSSIYLFDRLTDSQRKSIARFSRKIDFARNAIVFEENSPAESLYVVVYGKFKIFRLTASGDEKIMHVQGPGDLIAEAAIFDDGTYPAGCSALKDGTLIAVSGREFKRFLSENPDVALKMMASYSRRLRDFARTIENLSLQDMKGRLADYILKNSTQKGSVLFFEYRMTKKELASTLGTIKETLSRTLNFFKKEGVLKEGEGGLEVLTHEKLRGFIR